MLGIFTRYCFCEATYAALRMAQWASARNMEVSICPSNPTPPQLGYAWDRKVAETSRQQFTDWAKSCEYVLWTHTPYYEQIKWAANHKIKTLILAPWNHFDRGQRDALKTAGIVLCTSRERANHLKRKWYVANPIYLPWDNGLPIVRRSPRESNYVVVLLPMFDREVFRMEATAMELAGRLLYYHDNVILLACYNSSTIASYAKRRLKEFRRCFGEDRVRELRNVHPNDRHFVYMQSDITLWPCHSVGFGMVGVDSLSMGTPVAAFAYSPVTEILQTQNAVLADAGGYTDNDGIRHPQPDYESMEKHLSTVIQNRPLLNKLQSNAPVGLVDRRVMFDDVLSRVFK